MNEAGVLAICPRDWSGIRKSISGKASWWADIREARAAIRLYRPAVVRFGGYSRKWRSVVRFARRRGCRIVVTIHHTPAAHAFADSLRSALVDVIADFRAGLIDALETPHAGVAETLTILGVPCGATVNTLDGPPDPVDLVPRAGLHIGILGTGMPWKNMDTQILAATLVVRESGSGGMIHLQSVGDSSLLDALGVPFEKHARVDEDRFYRLVASMTLNMAANFTDAFGYLPVESFLLGVPCLFSPMTAAFHGVDERSPLWSCRVDRIDDPAYVAQKIRGALGDRKAIVEAGRAFCRRYVTERPRSTAEP